MQSKPPYTIYTNLNPDTHPPSEFVFQIFTNQKWIWRKPLPEFNTFDRTPGTFRLEFDKFSDPLDGSKYKSFLIIENISDTELHIQKGKKIYSNNRSSPKTITVEYEYRLQKTNELRRGFYFIELDFYCALMHESNLA